MHPVTVVAVAGPAGNHIIGVALAFNWVDGAGIPTDVDRDAALVEICYYSRLAWGKSGGDVVDLYSIIAHDTRHAKGLAHVDKLFVTRRDAQNGMVTPISRTRRRH